MNILIVAKTKMNSGVCIGGLVLETNRSVRLLPERGKNHGFDTHFNVGQIWEMEIRDSDQFTPPHVEDVRIIRSRWIGEQPHLTRFLMERLEPWRGGVGQLFDGKLGFTSSGTAYIAHRRGLPRQSTGFWLPDQNLNYTNINNKDRYLYDSPSSQHFIPYVGFEAPIPSIEAGTLLRVSLARWWVAPNISDDEERCYLQLSGWYE